MPPLEFLIAFGQLPAFVQILTIIVGGATAWGAYRSYLLGLSKRELKPTDTVLTAAGITDMQPIRDLVVSVDRLTGETARSAIALEGIRELMFEQAEGVEFQRKLEEGIEKRMRQDRGEAPDDDQPRPRRTARRRE